MKCKPKLILNKIFTLFLLLLVLKSECCFSQAPNGQPTIIQAINISIDSVAGNFAVNPNLKGFSAENLFAEIKNTEDTTFVNQLKKINPTVLRWPGGMLSNFYHSSDNGYGLKKNEIAGIYLQYAQQLETQGIFAAQLKLNHSYSQDFLRLAQKLKAKVLITANILTGTPEELLDQLNFFNDNNIEVVGVELGDEMYLNTYRAVFPYPGSYISKAETFVTAVKKYFPKIKIGACAAPNPRLSDLDGTAAGEFVYFKAWNDALTKSDFYDAIIIHSYTPVQILKNQPVDSVFQRAVIESKKTFSKSGVMVQSLDYYKGIFPKKKMWITEWNLAIRSTNSYFLNTLYQSLYIGSYLNFINNFNRINKYPVEIAVFQSLATGGMYNHFGVIDIKSEKEKAKSAVVKRTAWYAFKNLDKLYSGKYFLHNSICSDSKLDVFTYHDTTSNTLLLSWMNYSGKEFKIDSLMHQQINYSNSEASFESIIGNLTDSYGWTRFSRNSYNTPPIDKTETKKLSEWVFPPYGMGTIRIKQ